MRRVRHTTSKVGMSEKYEKMQSFRAEKNPGTSGRSTDIITESLEVVQPLHR